MKFRVEGLEPSALLRVQSPPVLHGVLMRLLGVRLHPGAARAARETLHSHSFLLRPVATLWFFVVVVCLSVFLLSPPSGT